MTLSDIRHALDSLGRAPVKSLGQNFLHDQNLARAIVGQIEPQAGDCIVEIGPGLGALTEHLLESGAEVLALEKDGALAEHLREHFRGRRLEVRHGDALDFDLRTLWPRQPVKIIGNLPYYVSSQLIFHFMSSLCPAERALFLVQKEMASRLAAAPGTAEYGLPSVLIGRTWRIKSGRKLPPSVFFPEPNVDSALVELIPRPGDDLPPCVPEIFERAARAGFSQRRKQLRKLLAAEFPDLTWPVAQLPESIRAEELTLSQWVALANAIQTFGQAQDIHGEMFDVVDEEDRVVGLAPRGEVHAQGLRHRAVHLFVFNDAGEIFLQRRSLWKDDSPRRWGSSAAGHVDAGEEFRAAMEREITEELFLTPAEARACREIGTLPASRENGWEFVRLFTLHHGGPLRCPPAEVEASAFFPIPLVEGWLERRPEDFSPGFRQCWEAWRAARPV